MMVFMVAIQPIAYASTINSVAVERVCKLQIDFETKPRTKKQAINLSSTMQMAITNKVAINKSLKASVATNVTCQQLMGASYTGSEAEWAKFFDSALSGLVKSGFKELAFTLVGENDQVFNTNLTTSTNSIQPLIAKEYTFMGDIGGNKQVIRNLALLDKEYNILYTLSVSGNERVTTEIGQEFSRLVTSIRVPKQIKTSK